MADQEGSQPSEQPGAPRDGCVGPSSPESESAALAMKTAIGPHTPQEIRDWLERDDPAEDDGPDPL